MSLKIGFKFKLQKIQILRLIGILMLGSVVGNLLWISFWTGNPTWYRIHDMVELAKSITPLWWFLWIMTGFSGLFLVSGLEFSVDAALLVLFAVITMEVYTLKKLESFKWIHILSISCNIFIFSGIYYVKKYGDKIESFFNKNKEVSDGGLENSKELVATDSKEPKITPTIPSASLEPLAPLAPLVPLAQTDVVVPKAPIIANEIESKNNIIPESILSPNPIPNPILNPNINLNRSVENISSSNANEIKNDNLKTIYFNPGIELHFENIGLWGQVVEVNNQGVKVQVVSNNIPEKIETRTLEVKFIRNLALKVRFQFKENNNYFFSFIENQTAHLNQLNLWAQNISK